MGFAPSPPGGVQASGATPPDAGCTNCETVLRGPVCHSCGQAVDALPVSAPAFLRAQATALLGYDNRLWRTLALLVARPGELTRAYLAGRCVPYLSPLGTYLLAAGAFFVLHTLEPFVRFTPATRAFSASLSAVTVGGDLSEEQVRLLGAAGVPLALFGERFSATATSLLPLLLLAFIALFALVSRVLFPRAAQGGLRHGVFALHVGAFCLALRSLDRALAIVGVSAIPLAVAYSVATAVYLTLAIRRVYGHSWTRQIGTAVVLLVTFYALLAAWLSTVLALAVFWALRASGTA